VDGEVRQIVGRFRSDLSSRAFAYCDERSRAQFVERAVDRDDAGAVDADQKDVDFLVDVCAHAGRRGEVHKVRVEIAAAGQRPHDAVRFVLVDGKQVHGRVRHGSVSAMSGASFAWFAGLEVAESSLAGVRELVSEQRVHAPFFERELYEATLGGL
jgi:hypothetical protein